VAEPSIADGSFVWTLFPFGPPHRPELPGPTRHIAYVLAQSARQRPAQLLLAYTSSGPWRGASPAPPPGVIEFSATEAKALRQRPFHIDLRCLAQVSLTSAWFPDLGQLDHGVIAVAGVRLQARIQRVFDELVARNRHLIEIRGPR
jgi:hypothetical protein